MLRCESHFFLVKLCKHIISHGVDYHADILRTAHSHTRYRNSVRGNQTLTDLTAKIQNRDNLYKRRISSCAECASQEKTLKIERRDKAAAKLQRIEESLIPNQAVPPPAVPQILVDSFGSRSKNDNRDQCQFWSLVARTVLFLSL